tara:strand:+ start:358 stop:675 length:318 start_codon:yes stop_codon:yes gene_type:complete
MEIALDLDGTLAHYDKWRGVEHVGEPIPAMVKKLNDWVAQGHNVTLFTARVSDAEEAPDAGHYIGKWILKHELPITEITCIKKKKFDLFVDDKAISVIKNEGTFS